jgi:hypothetical protein
MAKGYTRVKTKDILSMEYGKIHCPLKANSGLKWLLTSPNKID